MSEILEDIKNKSYKNIYVVYGREKYLSDFYIQKLLGALLDNTTRDMNYDIFEEKSINIERLKESMETLPIFSEKRVVYLKNVGIFDKGNKQIAQKVLDIVNNIPPELCIVIEEEEFVKTSELYKKIKDIKTVGFVNCETQTEATLIKWIQKKLKELGKNIEPKVAAYMLRKVGFDMIKIINEIQKLADFKYNGDNILVNDIDEICIESVESKIFDLLNEIGRKNVAKAMDIYNNLQYLGEPVQRIFYMISRQFIIISDIKMLKEKGHRPEEIAKVTGTPVFAVGEQLRQVENFTHTKLKEILNKCLQIDIDVKRGNVNPQIALELLILESARR